MGGSLVMLCAGSGAMILPVFSQALCCRSCLSLSGCRSPPIHTTSSSPGFSHRFITCSRWIPGILDACISTCSTWDLAKWSVFLEVPLCTLFFPGPHCLVQFNFPKEGQCAGSWLRTKANMHFCSSHSPDTSLPRWTWHLHNLASLWQSTKFHSSTHQGWFSREAAGGSAFGAVFSSLKCVPAGPQNLSQSPFLRGDWGFW